jgi:hypothetical protein
MQSSNPNFQCSLDGYNKLTSKAFNAILTPLNLVVELLPTIMGYLSSLLGGKQITYLNKSFKYFYQYFTMTLPGSIGYLIAAAFYLTKYLGYGSYMCEASGYLFYVIYYADYANELLAQLAALSE